jgi:2-C-methyl-D-erythritol 4-phosphate cytidylyltransferase
LGSKDDDRSVVTSDAGRPFLIPYILPSVVKQPASTYASAGSASNKRYSINLI